MVDQIKMFSMLDQGLVLALTLGRVTQKMKTTSVEISVLIPKVYLKDRMLYEAFQLLLMLSHKYVLEHQRKHGALLLE